MCVYISQTSDPVAGGWFIYDFTTPNFPDYPKYAVWPDAYYVSSNESSSAAYALDRTRMLAGLSATSQRFTISDLSGFIFNALIPGDLDGARGILDSLTRGQPDDIPTRRLLAAWLQSSVLKLALKSRCSRRKNFHEERCVPEV